ncbi:hypothetical protein QBC43DRAFT_226887, partial [Cladorrhinum sp. PSN259]
MEHQSQRIPSVLDQPPSVDFIQKKLPQTLDVVKGAPVYYNPQSHRFEPLQTGAATMAPPSVGERTHCDQQEDDASTGREMAKKRNVELPVRELVPAVEAMVFWSAILEPAMTQFVNANYPEPEKLVKKPQFSIRAKTEWRGIHENLQSAQAEFNGADKPLQSRFKRIYRKAADHTETFQDVIGKLPDDGTYMSLVKFVLDLLFGAVRTAAQTRITATGFADEEDVKEGFSKVEIFLAAFPGDPNIEKASVDLVACVLKAVENAILYFISSTRSRMIGGSTRQALIDSINEVPAQTKKLMERVEESHIWAMQKASGLTLANIEELRLLSVKNSKAISWKTDQILNQGQEIILRLDSVGCIVQGYMQQFIQQQEMSDARIQAALEAQKTQFNRELEMLDARLKAENAELIAGMMNKLKESFDDFENNIVTKVRQAEMDDSIRSNQSAATSRNPSPAPEQEQWPSRWPPPSPSAPPSWPQAPYAAYQQQPYPQSDLRPQGNNLYLAPPPAQAHSHSQYYQQLLPPPPPVPEPTAIPVAALLSALGNLSGLDKRDIQSAFAQSQRIPLFYRLHAQEMIRAREFHAWATAPSSRELLILGDTSLEAVQAGAAVSLVAASLMESIRARGAKFSALGFFCGLHTQRDDAHAGAAVMIKALITQLLEQHYAGYTFRECDLGLDLERIAGGSTTAADLAALCALFEWLVKWLPRDKTLVVVVDGIGEYERAHFNDGMLVVLRCLLGLVAAEGKKQGPVVKVLATCPAGTISLRSEFRSKGLDSILLMEGLQVVSEQIDMSLG